MTLGPAPHPRRPALAPARAAALALAVTAACDRTHGEVELNWTVVDAAGSAVFPAGALDDLCRFTGRTTEAGERVDYGLRVELRLCEPGCAAGCGDPSCQAARLPFACDAARGFDTVEVGEYDFTVALVADLPAGTCDCELTSACALVPGPRTRAVEPGLVTDLQVYLFVLAGFRVGDPHDHSRPVLDLDGCCVPDPACSP